MVEDSHIHTEASYEMKLHELTSSYMWVFKEILWTISFRALETSAFKADHGFNCQAFQNSFLSAQSPLKAFSGDHNTYKDDEQQISQFIPSSSSSCPHDTHQKQFYNHYCQLNPPSSSLPPKYTYTTHSPHSLGVNTCIFQVPRTERRIIREMNGNGYFVRIG